MNASLPLVEMTHAPPRIAFGCGIGITGHRAEALPEIARGTIQARLKEVLGLIAESCHAIAHREASFFADAPPALTIVSPLAAGTDQMTAEIALSLGYRLHAVLPFARDEYAHDFDPGELAHFRRLLGRATGVFELPGKRSESMEAEAESYAMAGRATIAHCDVLVAVWDGLPARGRGGTAEVVLEALQRGLPIIHIPVAGSKPIRMIWSGFDPHVVTHAHNTATAERPFSKPLLDDLLSRLLAPPDDPDERSFLRAFAHEREHSLKPRIEYPLLLAAAGIKPLRRSAWYAAPYAETTRADWAPFRKACADDHGISTDIDVLEERLLLVRRAGDAFRPDLSLRPCLQLRAGRRRRRAGADRAADSGRQEGAGDLGTARPHLRHSQHQCPAARAPGTGAGWITGNWPNACGRCAA